MSEAEAQELERSRPSRLRPRDAATLMVVDRRGNDPQVLMGRRHAKLAFMPEKYVFPGGRVEPSDRLAPSAGALLPTIDAALAGPGGRVSPGRRRAIALAAIRETFEETGLLVGRRAGPGSTRSVPPAWQPFAEHGVEPDLSVLHLVGRAITPPGRPRRFDARFFAVERSAVCASVEGRVGPGKEFVELAWIPLRDTKGLDLPWITAFMLDALGAALESGFPAEGPRPFFYSRHGRHVVDTL